MINRTIQPTIDAIPKPELPRPENNRLDNGIPVFELNAGTQDVCKIDFIFKAGIWQQRFPLQANLTNSMLQEGSQKYTAEAIANLFDFHGAYLQLQIDHHRGWISIISLSRHLHKLIPVVADFINNSIFPQKEIDTLITRRKQKFLLELEKVSVLCQKKFSNLLFGDKHPYAQNLVIDDFEHVNRDMLVDFYNSAYQLNNVEIMLSGKFDSSIVDLLNKYFGQAFCFAPPVSDSEYCACSSPEHYSFIDKPDAIQSAIRIGKLMVCKDHPDYLPLQILVCILGGYFSSRLMANIREEKGYTYGINSSLVSFEQDGYLVISTEVDKSYEKATINEVFAELKRLREEIVGSDELNRVRQYLLGELIRDFDGPFARAQSFLSTHLFGLDLDYYEKYYRLLLGITPEQLLSLSQKYFDEDSFYIVVAGRK